MRDVFSLIWLALIELFRSRASLQVEILTLRHQYDPQGETIGSIERVMIEKASGKVSYAVLSFGGFLGIGDDHYPLPWASLKYDTQLGGYKTNVTSEKLKGAPKYSQSQTWDWEDRTRGRQVYDYYGTPWPY